jgi:predicted site-specific integrase-resolvase
MAPTKFYRPSAFAAILDIKPATVRRRIADGSIAAVRLSSRAIRIPESEVLRIQREGFAPPKAEE